jgi:hypothetical protein
MVTVREQSHFPYTANGGVQVHVTDKYDCKYVDNEIIGITLREMTGTWLSI